MDLRTHGHVDARDTLNMRPRGHAGPRWSEYRPAEWHLCYLLLVTRRTEVEDIFLFMYLFVHNIIIIRIVITIIS